MQHVLHVLHVLASASVLQSSVFVRIVLGWYHDEGAAKYGGGIPGYRTWPVGVCDRIRAEGLSASSFRFFVPGKFLVLHEHAGACMRAWPAGDEPALDEWTREMDALNYHFRPPPVDKYREGSWERVLCPSSRF